MMKELSSSFLMFVFLFITSFPVVFSAGLPIMIALVVIFRPEFLDTLYAWKVLLGYTCMIGSLVSLICPFLLPIDSKWKDREMINRRLKLFVLGMPIISYAVFVYYAGWFLVHLGRFLKTRFENELHGG